ncbi:MAG: hypothetical protein QME66_07110 [Candidatus Eisenbacteria bacterium]|nr:hypothetical protein [Candidatus Eisenbacteria bacterium]
MKKLLSVCAFLVAFSVLPCVSYGAPAPAPPVSPFEQLGLDSTALSWMVPAESIWVYAGVQESLSIVLVTSDEDASYQRTRLKPLIPPRNAGLAGVASLLVPGLGHAYNTDIGTSDGFFMAALSSVTVIAFSSYLGDPVTSIGRMIGLSGYILCQLSSAYDATSLAGRINDNLEGKKTAPTHSGESSRASPASHAQKAPGETQDNLKR